MPTLHVPPDTELAGYQRSLLDRFRNPALRHRTWQIAMDGTQKLPQRTLATVWPPGCRSTPTRSSSAASPPIPTPENRPAALAGCPRFH